MSRKLNVLWVVCLMVLVSVAMGINLVQPAEAQVACPPEIDRLISVRMPEMSRKVGEFYKSWSVNELNAGRKPGQGFTVAIGIGSLHNDTSLFGFWGLIRRLEAMGAKVVYMVGQGGSQSPENAALLENLIARNPDAAVFCFSNSQILAPGLQKAAQRKIPMFGLDNWLQGPTVVGEVTADNFDIGRKAANYLVQRLKGEGNVVHVFSPGHRGVEIRSKMWEIISKEYPGIKEIARLPYNPPNYIGGTRDRMEATLIANPKKGSIQAVHACFDLLGFGPADAIEAAGRQDEIFVVGIDGDREAFRRIAKGGAFQATVSQDFMVMGTTLAHQVIDHLNGKEVPRFVMVPTDLVTKDNVREIYKVKYGEDLKL